MELLGLLVILTAIADKVGRALGWCLVMSCKAFFLILVFVLKAILIAIKQSSEQSEQVQSPVAVSEPNPNIDDAIAGLKKLGLPEAIARKTVAAAAEAEPSADVGQLIKTSLQSLDRR